MRITGIIVCALLATSVPGAAAPHLIMDAGLVQEAGVQFIIDPTGISLRLRAESTLPLTGFAIRVNDRDVTDLVVRNSRIEVSPDGRSGSLVLERLSLFEIGFAPANAYRVEATVRDEEGATTIATLLAGAPPNIPFVTLASGSYSGISSLTHAVVRDVANWETLWRQHTSNVTPAAEPPAIDFSREIVIAVVLGSRPTGGYAVRIVAVEPSATDESAIIVHVEAISPAPGAVVTQAFTSPFHFVTIPRWDGAVQFNVLEVPSR